MQVGTWKEDQEHYKKDKRQQGKEEKREVREQSWAKTLVTSILPRKCVHGAWEDYYFLIDQSVMLIGNSHTFEENSCQQMEDVHANADIMAEFCHFKQTSKQMSKEDVATAKQQLQQQGPEDDNSIMEEIEDDDVHIESSRWHSILRQLYIDAYEEILRTNFQLIKQVKFWKMSNVIQTSNLDFNSVKSGAAEKERNVVGAVKVTVGIQDLQKDLKSENRIAELQMEFGLWIWNVWQKRLWRQMQKELLGSRLLDQGIMGLGQCMALAIGLCQSNFEKQDRQTKWALFENAYDAVVPLRMDIDREILLRFQCPLGLLPSSMLGLQSLTQELDEFGFEDFLNDPQSAKLFVHVDMHLGMEMQLCLSKALVACTFL
ncbi:hypothetical protein L7F22_054698 [Adiantum nelumboides]|nr:hypothetical protein [Adiantum nelumboides]